jgi:hypothetical protein
MHLLTWVGFGLIGYVPNTLYNTSVCFVFILITPKSMHVKSFASDDKHINVPRYPVVQETLSAYTHFNIIYCNSTQEHCTITSLYEK